MLQLQGLLLTMEYKIVQVKETLWLFGETFKHNSYNFLDSMISQELWIFRRLEIVETKMIDCFSSLKSSLIMPLLVCKLRKLLPLSSLISSKTLMILSGKGNRVRTKHDIGKFENVFSTYYFVLFLISCGILLKWITYEGGSYTVLKLLGLLPSISFWSSMSVVFALDGFSPIWVLSHLFKH